MDIRENLNPGFGSRRRRVGSDYGDIPIQTVKYVRYKANRTAMTLGWSGQDEEDLRQELFLDVLAKMRKWDESRGRSLASYLQMCTDARTKDLLKASRRMKRTSVALSLDACDDDGESGIDRIAGNVGQTCVQCDMVRDVRSIVGSLDRELKDACALLKQGKSWREVAVRLGRSRKYVAENILPRLRREFAELRDA